MSTAAYVSIATGLALAFGCARVKGVFGVHTLYVPSGDVDAYRWSHRLFSTEYQPILDTGTTAGPVQTCFLPVQILWRASGCNGDPLVVDITAESRGCV